jgi:flagellar biosynthesis protein FlhB
MRYKIKYSESDEFVVYRYFHYTPRQLGVRGFLATVCAAITVFLLIPLPDEIIIIPAIAKALQCFTELEFKSAISYAYIIYKSTGICFLCLSLLFSGQYLRDALWAKIKYFKNIKRTIQNIQNNTVHKH